MSELILMAMAALIVAVPPTMAGLAALQQAKKVQLTADQIHVLTNSNLSRVITDLNLANQRIENLERLIASTERVSREGS